MNYHWPNAQKHREQHQLKDGFGQRYQTILGRFSKFQGTLSRFWSNAASQKYYLDNDASSYRIELMLYIIQNPKHLFSFIPNRD